MLNTDNKIRTKDLTLTALFAALLCVISPFAVSIGPISITLATFGAYLSGAALGAKRASVAVAIYLMLGFVGLPVFSGFSGGIQKLFSATGGYLVGYIPCAAMTGLFADKFKKPWDCPVGMAVGTAVLYSRADALRRPVFGRRRNKNRLRLTSRPKAQRVFKAQVIGVIL